LHDDGNTPSPTLKIDQFMSCVKQLQEVQGLPLELSSGGSKIYHITLDRTEGGWVH
jgi:hypothetical protein